MDAHEVGLGQQGVEVDEADTHLRGPAGLHVGVVRDDLHPEGAEPLGDEYADAAEADDADGLLVELDAGVLRPLPLAVLQRGVGRADVAGRGEHQRDGELGGGDDVGGRRVDDHDPALGGRLHVDVVEAHTGAGDDLQPLRGGQRLRVDLGGGAHQDRVDVGDGGQQLGAVGAVAVPDLEVGAERVHGGGAELFGDEYDGLVSHSGPQDRSRMVEVHDAVRATPYPAPSAHRSRSQRPAASWRATVPRRAAYVTTKPIIRAKSTPRLANAQAPSLPPRPSCRR